MRKHGIITLAASAVFMCGLAMFQMLPTSKAIFVVLCFAGMQAGVVVDLYGHCKCDEEKKAGS